MRLYEVTSPLKVASTNYGLGTRHDINPDPAIGIWEVAAKVCEVAKRGYTNVTVTKDVDRVQAGQYEMFHFEYNVHPGDRVDITFHDKDFPNFEVNMQVRFQYRMGSDGKLAQFQAIATGIKGIKATYTSMLHNGSFVEAVVEVLHRAINTEISKLLDTIDEQGEQ